MRQPARKPPDDQRGTEALHLLLPQTSAAAGKDGLDLVDIDCAQALCPYSTTTTAWELPTDTRWMFADGCGKWDCEICGPRKKARLVRAITRARPTKFITLTCLHVEDAAHQHDRLTKALPRLATWARQTHGEFEYVRLEEECKDGYPHFHLLARSPYLPQHQLSAQWKKTTGATVVDVRKAHGRSVRYVSKYVTKAADASGRWNRQRISVSQNFWTEEDIQPMELLLFEHSRQHPSDWAANLNNEYAIERIRRGAYNVVTRQPGDELPDELR